MYVYIALGDGGWGGRWCLPYSKEGDVWHKFWKEPLKDTCNIFKKIDIFWFIKHVLMLLTSSKPVL